MVNLGSPCSVLRTKLYLIRTTLLLQIGFASAVNENSPIRQISDPEHGFAWDPYSPNCNTQARAFPLTPDRSDTPPDTQAKSPQSQSSAQSYSSKEISSNHCPGAPSNASPLPPTELPRCEDQYIRALPSGMSTHYLIIL